MSERTNAAAMNAMLGTSRFLPDGVRNRRASVEVLIGRLLWGALLLVVIWVGTN